jgi:ABC-2 type transport system permease protein
MRHFGTLLRHELRALFISPATYIAAVLALLLMGFFYFLTLLSLTEGEQGRQPATLFFSTFWVPALLIVPMLTMKSLAEERRLGTLEALLTTPVTTLAVVLAKFTAAWCFYQLVWLAALIYPWLSAMLIDQPEMTARLLDRGSILGGLLFIALSGTLFVAVGIFSSSLTRSQLVAGMLSFSIIFLLVVGVAALRILPAGPGDAATWSQPLLGYLQVFQHFEDFSRGVIDTRPLAYYLSGAALVLGLACLMVEYRR